MISVEFESIKNLLKDFCYYYLFLKGQLMFLAGAFVLDDILDVLHMP